MTIFLQSLQKKSSLFLLPLGILMLAVSISSAADEQVTHFCDGLLCLSGSDCGPFCLCNVGADPPLCVDNDIVQEK